MSVEERMNITHMTEFEAFTCVFGIFVVLIIVGVICFVIKQNCDQGD